MSKANTNYITDLRSSATVIDLASRRDAANVAAIGSSGQLQGTTEFAGLPFTSAETNDYGWPVSMWTLDENSTCQQGKDYALLALRIIAKDHPKYGNGRRALALTLEAIIMQQVALRAKGGKGSRSMTNAAYGFLAGISGFIGTVASLAGKGDLS